MAFEIIGRGYFVYSAARHSTGSVGEKDTFETSPDGIADCVQEGVLLSMCYPLR